MSLSVNIRSRTSRTKTSRTTVNVGQNTRRPKHYVEQHDVEQQPPHQINIFSIFLQFFMPERRILKKCHKNKIEAISKKQKIEHSALHLPCFDNDSKTWKVELIFFEAKCEYFSFFWQF
jgi:hypothetical protein